VTGGRINNNNNNNSKEYGSSISGRWVCGGGECVCMCVCGSYCECVGVTVSV
jgi:hypothetical protein